MPRVRSHGPDVVIRYAGKRLRVTRDWVYVPEDALSKLAEYGFELEPLRESTTSAADLPPPVDDEAAPQRRKRGRRAAAY